jgi:hypothetical protein
LIARLVSLALIFLSSCSEEKKATSAAPPEYQTLYRPGFKGALFQFEHDGDYYLACSIHQGSTAPDVEIFREGQKTPVVVGQRVHIQKDLHVWDYDEDTLSPDHALSYQPEPKVEVGDRIYLLNKGQKIAATIVAEPKGKNFRYTYETDEPFPAGGMSGSPVYLPRTGSVIGVLQTANDKKKATLGGFELLELE